MCIRDSKDGKLGRMFKNPSYSGITPEFWNSCDAICSVDEYVNWGVPNCGKGQPMQTMWTGHGAAPARFRNVQVGIATSDADTPNAGTSNANKAEAGSGEVGTAGSRTESQGGAK